MESSLYTSSRHALTRPTARYATEGTISVSLSPSILDRTLNTVSPIASAASSVRRHISRPSASIFFFSQPASQKRCASSKPRPPVAPFRSKPTDQKSNVAKPLVYRGREAASSNKNDYTNNLSSNPYLRGRSISPSSSPNAIFEPQIRRPSIVIRPPPSSSVPSEDTAAPNTAPPASSPSQANATFEQRPAASTSSPQQESQASSYTPAPPLEQAGRASPSSTTTSSSPRSPVQPASDRGLAHAVDDVAVPEGITSAERPPVIQPKGSHPSIKDQRVGSIESRASMFDEVLRLEQRNSKLESTLAQHRKDYQELRQAHDKLQESSTRTIQDAQRLEIQARERLQITSKKFEKDRLDLQTTARKQEGARVELSRQLVEVKKELEKEREAAKQQQRRAADRQFENTLRLREKEEKAKAARKLLRKDYNTFRAWVHVGVTKTAAILDGSDLLPRQDAWYNREIAYWTKALQSTQSFEVTSKGGDQIRYWEAGEQVQKTTQDPQKRDTLRRRVVHQVEQRLQHRDSILDQVKEYLRSSSLEASRAHSEYNARVEDLREKFAVIKSRQHDYRRVLRETRFGLDSRLQSPELTAASRASAIDLYEMDRPIAEINGAVAARMTFWNRKLKALMAQKSDTPDMGSMIRFYRTQLRVLAACKSLLATIRVFSALQLEALEADWISEQPAYQQLFWQTSTRITRRLTHVRTKANMTAKELRAQGLGGRHKILSLREIDKIVETSVLHERAAFAYAYVKHKKNAFTQDDNSEISEVLAKYRQENTQESKRYLKQLEQVRQISDDIYDVRHSRALGKRLLVPVRTRRRENLRKAALAKTRQDEGVVEDQATPVEAAAGTTTDIPRSASDAEMTSRDTSAGSTADLEKSESSQQEAAQSPEPNTTTEPGSATSEKSSSDLAQSLPEPQTKPRGPDFKVAKIPRLTPKATTVYPRARSKSLFRPPKPMFKETKRRSQMMSTSSADCLDQEDLGRSTTLPLLLHHIPPQDLRNALMASKTSQAAFWKYSLYKSPKGEKPLVHYCTNLKQAEYAAKYFSEEPVIGFDIEWEAGSTIAENSIKDNVSLIQIACDDRIALFHVALFFGERAEDLMPPSLKAILESPEILKTGVNIASDFTRLRKCLGVEGQGIFELSHLYKLVKFSENEPAKVDKKPFNLAGQVQDVLFLPLHKGIVRTSAWSRKLSKEQTDYAASDAYAGFRLFRELDKARSLMNPMPPRPAPWEFHQPIILGNGERAGRKISTKKSTGLESQLSMLSVGEEQTFNIEEEEAQDEAGADDLEDNPAQDELESFENESATPVKHEAAERWLAQWASNSTLGRKNKPPSPIRAYALWQVEGLELQQVAEAMREPPLALSTVAAYVVQVVKSQKLPHEPARLQVALEMEERRSKSSIQKTRSII
ncbi:ribonuclease H-like protein [Aureobasidium sp. EXF-12298]|nr:ribonuclease H-like protein [Aureobasidium sp. EXF-12298]